MRDSIIMTKYQGFGNDYLVLDAKKNQLQLQGKKVALLCQRGFGLGADGVLYGPVDINGKMGMHIFNSDGSEAAISGNGVCIFAKYLMDNEYVTEKKFAIEIFIRNNRSRVSECQSDRVPRKYGQSLFPFQRDSGNWRGA